MRSFQCSATIGILVLLSMNCSLALGQSVRKFELELGAGKSESAKSYIFYFEPKHRLSARHKLGLRIEAFKIDLERSAFSFTLNDQFYFLKNSDFASEFHPFVGLGAGVLFPQNYHTAFPVTNPGGGWYYARIDGESFKAQMVVYPRVGVDYRRFTLTFDYNLMYRKLLTITYFDPVSQTDLPPSSFYRSDNYFAMKLGFRLWGPERK
jgi:hypothetical protein